LSNLDQCNYYFKPLLKFREDVFTRSQLGQPHWTKQTFPIDTNSMLHFFKRHSKLSISLKLKALITEQIIFGSQKFEFFKEIPGEAR